MLNAARKTNMHCEEKYGFDSFLYPCMVPEKVGPPIRGQCLVSNLMNYEDSCDKPGNSFIRFCPCEPLSGSTANPTLPDNAKTTIKTTTTADPTPPDNAKTTTQTTTKTMTNSKTTTKGPVIR